MTLKCIFVVRDESSGGGSSSKNGNNNNVMVIQRSFTFSMIPFSLTKLQETLQEYDLRLQLMPFVITACNLTSEDKKVKLDSDKAVSTFFRDVKNRNVVEVKLEVTIIATSNQTDDAINRNESHHIDKTSHHKEHLSPIEKHKNSKLHTAHTHHANKAAHNTMNENVNSNNNNNNNSNNNAERANAEHEKAMMHNMFSSTFADEELIKLVIYAPKQAIMSNKSHERTQDGSNSSDKNITAHNNYCLGISKEHSKSNLTSAEELSSASRESNVIEKMFVIPGTGVIEALYRAVGDTIPQVYLKAQLSYTKFIVLYVINDHNEKSTVELKEQYSNDHKLRELLLQHARAHCSFRVTYVMKDTKPVALPKQPNVEANVSNQLEQNNNTAEENQEPVKKEEANKTSEYIQVQPSSMLIVENVQKTKPEHKEESNEEPSCKEQSNTIQQINKEQNNDVLSTSTEKRDAIYAKSEGHLENEERFGLPEKHNKLTTSKIRTEKDKEHTSELLHTKAKLKSEDVPCASVKRNEHVFTSQELLRSSSVEIILEMTRFVSSSTNEETEKTECNGNHEIKEKEWLQQQEEQEHHMTFSYNKHEAALLTRLYAKCKELCECCNIPFCENKISISSSSNSSSSNNSNNIINKEESKIKEDSCYLLDNIVLEVIAGGEVHSLCTENDLREWLALAQEANRPLRLKMKCYFTEIKNRSTREHQHNVTRSNKNSKNIKTSSNENNDKNDEQRNVIERRAQFNTAAENVNFRQVAPFSVAVSVATKPNTSSHSSNDILDEDDSKSEGKLNTQEQEITNESKKIKGTLYSKFVKVQTPDNKRNIKPNISKVNVQNDQSVNLIFSHEDAKQVGLNQETIPVPCQLCLNEDNNNNSNNNKSTKSNNNIDVASEVSSVNKVPNLTNIIEEKHSANAHNPKKGRKIQYKYTYLCHELRSPSLHSEHTQAKDKSKMEITNSEHEKNPSMFIRKKPEQIPTNIYFSER